MKLRNRKAKIVATLGPACETEKAIEQLFLSGADVFRLNFSHGDHEDHKKKVKIIRNLEKKHDRYICILGDLQGPKFRVGRFSNVKEQLKKNQIFTFDQNKKEGDDSRVYLPHKEIFKSIAIGQRLLINDGKVRLKVKSKSKSSIKCVVTDGGEISNNKGLNIPDTKLDLKIITPKDKKDLELAIKLDVDWIALSFIQTTKDLLTAKKLIPAKFKVMVKVEKPSAMEEIEKRLGADAMIISTNRVEGQIEIVATNDDPSKYQKTKEPLVLDENYRIKGFSDILNSKLSADDKPLKNEFSDSQNEIVENAENIKSEIDKLVELSIRSAPVIENKTDVLDQFQIAGIKKSLIKSAEYLDSSVSIKDTSKILAKSFINGKCDHFESSAIYLVTGDEANKVTSLLFSIP